MINRLNHQDAIDYEWHGWCVCTCLCHVHLVISCHFPSASARNDVDCGRISQHLRGMRGQRNLHGTASAQGRSTWELTPGPKWGNQSQTSVLGWNMLKQSPKNQIDASSFIDCVFYVSIFYYIILLYIIVYYFIIYFYCIILCVVILGYLLLFYIILYHIIF